MRNKINFNWHNLPRFPFLNWYSVCVNNKPRIQVKPRGDAVLTNLKKTVKLSWEDSEEWKWMHLPLFPLSHLHLHTFSFSVLILTIFSSREQAISTVTTENLTEYESRTKEMWERSCVKELHSFSLISSWSSHSFSIDCFTLCPREQWMELNFSVMSKSVVNRLERSLFYFHSIFTILVCIIFANFIYHWRALARARALALAF